MSRETDHGELADEYGVGSHQLLRDALAYARTREYRGNDYCDGMSSRLRRWLPFENRWVNLLFQESVKRAPVDIRPLLLVERRRNFMGCALFTLANRNAYRLTGTDRFQDEALALADWLVENQCEGWSGFCGTHQHAVQHLDWQGTPANPDVVSTHFGVRALLDVGDIEPRFSQRALTAADFLLEDLSCHEADIGERIPYTPRHPVEPTTVNAVALGGWLLLELSEQLDRTDRPMVVDHDREHLRERATALLDYVASRQTDLGGWMYRDPPSASHLSMDNHHNGFIIEAFLRYRDVLGGARYDDVLDRALEFYRQRLFEPTGAPNWDERSSYPRDAHAAAQGILVFTKTGDLAFANRILEWTLEHLYGEDGGFYYQQRRFYTKRFTLMRWSQAWLTYAISEHLLARASTSEAASRLELNA